MDCQNLLLLEGSEEEIWRFVQLTIQTDDLVYYLEHETVLSFKKLHPISEEDVKGSEKGILEDVEADYDEVTHSCKFTTELHAPINTILAISKQFPSLRFVLEYLHLGHFGERFAFHGILKCQNGKILLKRGNIVLVKICPHCHRAEETKELSDASRL